MKRNKVIQLILLVLPAVLIISCGMDPWVADEKYPNIVQVTKTTRYAVAPDGKPMTPQTGQVRFVHKIHEDNGIQCVACHHKKDNPERTKQCAVCHKGDKGYATMHGFCLGCHIKNGKGPHDNCIDCHKGTSIK